MKTKIYLASAFLIFLISYSTVQSKSRAKPPKPVDVREEVVSTKKPCKFQFKHYYAWVDRMPSTQPKEPMIRIKLSYDVFGPGYIKTPTVFVEKDSKKLNIIHNELLNEVASTVLTKLDTIHVEQLLEVVHGSVSNLNLFWVEPNSNDTLQIKDLKIDSVH